MVNNRIKIELKGQKVDNDLVRLKDFALSLFAVSGIVTRLDHNLSKIPSSSFYLRIISLHLASPATIEVETIPFEPTLDYSKEAINEFFLALKDILSKNPSTKFDSEILKLYKQIGRVFKRDVTEIAFSSGDVKIRVVENIEPFIDEILGEDEIVQGSVSGILEYINIHAEANKFYIYPIAGAKRIDCHFPDSLLELATTSINRYINIQGKIKYKKTDNFPYAVDVENIEIYPQENELPNLFDLRGIAPDATSGLTSEEFVRRIRDEE